MTWCMVTKKETYTKIARRAGFTYINCVLVRDWICIFINLYFLILWTGYVDIREYDINIKYYP